LLTETDHAPELKPIKLGKKIELRYIPFSELAIPWNACFDATKSKPENHKTSQSRLSTFKQSNPNSSKAARTWKNGNLESLKRSIAQYGLLKPFEVAEIQERLDFFYGNGKYLVIDGQRRYFATEDEEKKRKENLRTDSVYDSIVKAEMQAQRQFDKLSVRDYVLIPCLVYPYTTLLQMMRHSIEDKRFSEQPSKEDFQLVEKMSVEGINDLYSDNLTELWNTRPRIEEEKLSIEKTLEEIRDKLKKEQTQK
jgi:ParB-like chromosome segregation protein Spo0J